MDESGVVRQENESLRERVTALEAETDYLQGLLSSQRVQQSDELLQLLSRLDPEAIFDDLCDPQEIMQMLYRVVDCLTARLHEQDERVESILAGHAD